LDLHSWKNIDVFLDPLILNKRWIVGYWKIKCHF